MGARRFAELPARPFRFSAQITHASDQRAWLDRVRFLEDHGFSSVSVPDHLSAMLPQWSPLVALGASAVATTTLRLAISVIDTDFHHPAVLAKEVATLDVLSGGRVDLGLGAGWLERDYLETGIAWERPGARIERLAESVSVLKQLFTGEPLVHEGKHFRIDGFQAFPVPAAKRVPILIGGGGKKVLSLAAREADIISVITNLGGATAHRSGDMRVDAFEEQLSWVETAATDADRMGEITLGIRVLMAAVADDVDAAAVELGAARGLTGDEVKASPFCFVGPLGRIEEHVHAVRERYGISYFTIHGENAEALAPLVAKLASG